MMNEDQPTKDPFTIRPCHLDDEPGALSVCLCTGDAGLDASQQFDDSNVLGYRYVSPYIHFSPELAFVLEDMDKNICGYVLATLESGQFYQRYVNEWLPKMKIRYPTIPSSEYHQFLFQYRLRILLKINFFISRIYQQRSRNNCQFPQ